MPNVSWEDIGGLENVKRELQEVDLRQGSHSKETRVEVDQSLKMA